MDEGRAIVGLLIGLCYWFWPIAVYLQTGSWSRSALAMAIEVLSSAVLFLLRVPSSGVG